MPPRPRPPRSRRPYPLAERDRALILERAALEPELVVRLRVVTHEGGQVVLWLTGPEAETLADRVRAAAEAEPERAIRRELQRLGALLGGRRADPPHAETPPPRAGWPDRPVRLRRLTLPLTPEERELVATRTGALPDLPARARQRLTTDRTLPLKLCYTHARDLLERLDEAAFDGALDDDRAYRQLLDLRDRIEATVREQWPECGGRRGRSRRDDGTPGCHVVRVHPDQRIALSFRPDELDRLRTLAELPDDLRFRLDAALLRDPLADGAPLAWLTPIEMEELIDLGTEEAVRGGRTEEGEAWGALTDRIGDVFGAHDDGTMDGLGLSS